MRVYLERMSLRREPEFLTFVRGSRRLHNGYVAPPATPEEYRDYLKVLRRKDQEAFFVTLRDSDEMAGVVTIDDIARGSFQYANLGYYAFARYAGRGYMREGVRLAVHHCFRALKLHRLEASIQPSNQRSIEIVSQLGFRKEGIAVRYAKIAGRWRDHERWALLADEWRTHQRVGATSVATADRD